MKEIDLVNELNREFSKGNVLHANELRMGIGIPDIACLDYFTDIPNIDNFFVLKLYTHIYHGMEINELYQTLSIERNRINSFLKVLKNENILEIKDGSILIKRQINFEETPELTSIEVKIRDWKAGLNQAIRYHMFSDYSYLAISADYLHNVKTSHFQEPGIGLISISENNNKLIIRAQKNIGYDKSYKYIALSLLQKKHRINSKNSIHSQSFDSVFF
jgi:hypothetical protein